MRELLVNKIQCPDGTILESRHRHDFVMHTQEDGREYFVDGGLDYQRVGFTDRDYINLVIYADDPHEKIREGFIWVSKYDKDMHLLPEPVKVILKDMTDEHLTALVDWTKEGYPNKIHNVMVNEFKWRNL